MSTPAHLPQDGPGGRGAEEVSTGGPRPAAGASRGDPAWRPDDALVSRVRREIAAAAAAAEATSRAAGGDRPSVGAHSAGRAAVPPVSAALAWTLRRRSGLGRSALVALAATVAWAVATGPRSGGHDGEDRR